jgi:hypothetical protein
MTNLWDRFCFSTSACSKSSTPCPLLGSKYRFCSGRPSSLLPPAFPSPAPDADPPPVTADPLGVVDDLISFDVSLWRAASFEGEEEEEEEEDED